MSQRRAVLDAVRMATATLQRAATSAEVRDHLAPENVPRHFATALGSLVRTGAVEAIPARDWPREPRRVYRLAGDSVPVDQSVVLPSRPEVVHRAVLTLFTEADNRAVTSTELRRHLADSEEGRQVVAHPAHLPTALNVLSKGDAENPPLLQSVRVGGIRAQCWVPVGAEVRATPAVSADGTAADRLADLVNHASTLSSDGLVTAADIAWLARRFPEHRIAAKDAARLLADSTRSVTHRGARQLRVDPALVCLGEVQGKALYAPAGPGWQHGEQAKTAYAWRELAEAWEEARIEDELEVLSGLAHHSPWYRARCEALARLLRPLVAQLNGLDGQMHPVPDVETERSALRGAIQHAVGFLDGHLMSVDGTSSTPNGVWLPPREAGDLLREGFGLTEDPPTIESGFLTEEVHRIRERAVTRGTKRPKGPRAESWHYDRVTLLLAGALRWADPEIGAMVALGAGLLGHIRSFGELGSIVGHPTVSVTELTAAVAVLGDEAGRRFLEGIVAQESVPRSARTFAQQGLELLDWIEAGCEGRLWAS